MKRLLTCLVILALLATGALAEKHTLYYLSGDGKTSTEVVCETDAQEIAQLLELLRNAPFGTDVQAVLTDRTNVSVLLSVNGYTLIGIQTHEKSEEPVYECIGRTLSENTNSALVAFIENGRFAARYPQNGSCALYLPEKSGRYIVPVVCHAEDMGAMALLQLLSEEREGVMRGIPGSVQDAELTYSIADDGRRVLSVDFPMGVFTALENSDETRWQFLASVSMTLLTNVPEIDCIRVSFEGQDVTGVPDRDGTLLKLGDGNVELMTFAGYTASQVADGRFISAADSRNLGALLACVLPELIESGDVTSFTVNNGAADVSLSRAFYALCGGMDEQTESDTVYAIVNTLCENMGAEKVRILIEEQSVSTLSGSISLEGYLMPKATVQR